MSRPRPRPAQDRGDLIASLGPIWRRCQLDDNGCFLWTGATTGRGRPAARIHGRWMHLGRLVLLARGIDLDGKVVHHTCGRPLCLAPGHLRAMTQAAHLAEHRRLRAERAAA